MVMTHSHACQPDAFRERVHAPSASGSTATMAVTILPMLISWSE